MSEPTVTVRLAYGETGLDVELPAARTTVVEPTYVAAAEDQRGLLREALRHPVEGPPLLLVLVALAVIPVLIIRTVVGVRPVSAAPDVASLELAARRSRFSPLVSDLQA